MVDDRANRRLTHIIPDIANWPISQLNDARASFVDDIVADVSRELNEKSQAELLAELDQAIRMEERRMSHDSWNVDPPNERAFWRSIRTAVQAIEQLPEHNLQARQSTMDTLERIIRVYAEEIAGRFKPQMFRFARRFSNVFFKFLFSRFGDGKLLFWSSLKRLADRIRVVGPIDHIRQLFQHGTVIFLPTHSSNLDSLFLGYAIDSYVGVPSSHYGAGLNLYNSEIAGYFMNRMGAYRVDRRKKNYFYLETLKAASRLSIMRGVSNLFFPGGTRSRSGELEQQLKLGLLGTTVEAQRELLIHDGATRVFIVPIVLSYSKVLEDHQLFKNYLHKQGLYGSYKKKIKHYSKIKVFWQLLSGIFSDRITAYVSIGQPIDVFGNAVNEVGRSVDKTGALLRKEDYFKHGELINKDVQREGQYTRHLADYVAQSYRLNNVIWAGQIVCMALLQAIKQESKATTIDALMKVAVSEWGVDTNIFQEHLMGLVHTVSDLVESGACHIQREFEAIRTVSHTQLIEQAQIQLRAYSNYKIIDYHQDRVSTDHLALVIFYSNRLNCYLSDPNLT